MFSVNLGLKLNAKKKKIRKNRHDKQYFGKITFLATPIVSLCKLKKNRNKYKEKPTIPSLQ